MYFVKKKDLKIVGKVWPHIVEFQMEDNHYMSDKVKLLESQNND